MNDPLQPLRKILNRAPGIPFGWAIHDGLSAWLLLRRHGDGIHERLGSARSPEDYFDLAAGPPAIFPPHQSRVEICGFLRHVAGIAPKVALEIGTAESGTNFLLGQCLLTLELLIGVDLRPRNLWLLERLSRPDLSRRIMRGSSRSRKTLERIQAVLAGRQIDLLFIDGDHTFEGVKADFETFYPMVSDGGLVAFHDIVEDHGARFGLQTGRWAGDVPRYWREISPRRKGLVEFVENPGQDGLGMGAFRK